MASYVSQISSFFQSRLQETNKTPDWESLVDQYPWYPMVYIPLAAKNAKHTVLQEKAAAMIGSPLRLQWMLQEENEITPIPDASNIIWTFSDFDEVAEPERSQIDEIIVPIPNIEAENPLQTADFQVLPISDADELDINQYSLQLNDAKIEAISDSELQTENEFLVAEAKVENSIADSVAPSDPIIGAIEIEANPSLDNIEEDYKIPIENDELDVLETYYAQDYFSTQGIQVDRTIPKQPVLEQDHHERKFTDWLKTMNRLSIENDRNYADPLVEIRARASIEDVGVVTEAMADVWEKQGQIDKAIGIIEKLQLLHPEKYTYFAARLKVLKAIL